MAIVLYKVMCHKLLEMKDRSKKNRLEKIKVQISIF